MIYKKFIVDPSIFDKNGKCKECKGVGKLIVVNKDNRTKSLCRFCGGYGYFDWVSEIMKKEIKFLNGLYVMEDGKHIIIKDGFKIT